MLKVEDLKIGDKFHFLDNNTGKITIRVIAKLDNTLSSCNKNWLRISFNGLKISVRFDTLLWNVDGGFPYQFTFSSKRFYVFTNEHLAQKFLIETWLPNQIESIKQEANKMQSTYMNLISKCGDTEERLKKETEKFNKSATKFKEVVTQL